MGIPVSQMWTVAAYVLRQRFTGRARYPLVMMLEPLFRCNLACAGCGKIQYPAHVLKMNLSPNLKNASGRWMNAARTDAFRFPAANR